MRKQGVKIVNRLKNLFVDSQKRRILLKLGTFSEITDFGKIIEKNFKLCKILTKDKYILQLIVCVVMLKLRNLYMHHHGFEFSFMIMQIHIFPPFFSFYYNR